MKLLRMETKWDRVDTMEHFSLERLGKDVGDVQVRQNQFNDHIVRTAISGLSPEQVLQKFLMQKLVFQSRCVQMNLYYEASTSGIPVPVKLLNQLGFKRTEPFIWKYDHPDYHVAAIAFPNNSNSEWVLQINKHHEGGIPTAACTFAGLFERQLQLALDEADEVVIA